MMTSKLKQIQILQKRGLNLNDIGKKLHPSITGERVRQLLNPVETWVCLKHKARFNKGQKCSYCKIEREYPTQLRKIAKEGTIQLAIEFHRLSKDNRNRGIVIQRTLLIKYLKDKHKVTLTNIARLLNRDYTTIKHNYQKKI